MTTLIIREAQNRWALRLRLNLFGKRCYHSYADVNIN